MAVLSELEVSALCRLEDIELRLLELEAREAERERRQRDRLLSQAITYPDTDEWLPTSDVIKLDLPGINGNLLRNREKHGWEVGVHYRQFGKRNFEYNVPVICHWRDHFHDPSAHSQWLRERQRRVTKGIPSALSYPVPG